MKKFIVGAMAALMLCSALPADADGLQLCVKNKPYRAATVQQNGDISAALDELLTAVGYGWKVEGNEVDIIPGSAKGPELSGSDYTVKFNGKPVGMKLKNVHGKPYVDVASFSKALGLDYKISLILGTADLYVPVSKNAVGASWGSQAQASDEAAPADGDKKPAKKAVKLNAQGQIETDGTNPDSPVLVTDFQFQDSTTASQNYIGEVRASAAFVNSGNKDLTNVTAHIYVCSLNGDVYNDWVMNVGTLKAGQAVQFNPDPPVWYNYSKIFSEGKILIMHDPIPEDKPAKKVEAPAEEAAPAE